MEENKLKLPYFAKGTLDDLTYALSDKGYYKDLDRIMYCYIEDTGEFAFIDSDKEIHRIVGNNLSHTERLDAIDSNISTMNEELVLLSSSTEELNINKADKADSLAGYGIENAYTKEEVETFVADSVSSAVGEVSGKVDVEGTVSEAIGTSKDEAISEAVDQSKSYINNALQIYVL